MPASPREIVLCRYRYDPLDRLIDYAPDDEPDARRFYCKSRLATEIQGVAQRSLFQHDDQVLAQIRREDVGVETALLATDQQRSVLNVLEAKQVHSLAYSPYGHRPAENGLLNLLGFNGEQPDPVTRHYLLGNGYRAFNPVLMRFNSPDSLSPFGEGGLNAYGYCWGDPINRKDPTGHVSAVGWRWIRQNIGFILDRQAKVSTLTLDGSLPTPRLHPPLARAGVPVLWEGKNINPLTHLNEAWGKEQPMLLDKIGDVEIKNFADAIQKRNNEVTIEVLDPNDANTPLSLKTEIFDSAIDVNYFSALSPLSIS